MPRGHLALLAGSELPEFESSGGVLARLLEHCLLTAKVRIGCQQADASVLWGGALH